MTCGRATKTLRGLFGNRPHFTRALDRTSTVMVDAEFRVAGKGSGKDPWFSVDPEVYPWIREISGERVWGPIELRRALLTFLREFNPEHNPGVGASLSAEQGRGLELFAAHCESCHQARLRTDDPGSRLPKEAWAANITGGGTIVWASDERVKTGVEPYVHEEGARVTSLRRLWIKRPYFTNGHVAELDALLAEVDLEPPFSHAAKVPRRALSGDERAALRAFLDVL